MTRSTYKRLWFSLASLACLLGFSLLLLFYVNTPRTSDVLPAATATQAIPTIVTAATALPATETPRPAFAFGTLGEIDSIIIIDNKIGLTSQPNANYVLHLDGGIFKGPATFSPIRPSIGSSVRQITVQPEPIKKFFIMLEKVVTEPPVPEGTPQALPTPSECVYPNPISIELRNPAQEAVVQFNATGCLGYYPWAVIQNGRTFITYSDIPSQAITFIESYMRKDVFDALMAGKTPAP